GLTLDVFTQKDYLAHLAFFVQQRNQSGIDDETRGLISRHDAVQALARRHVMRARRERPELTEAEANGEMGAFLDYVCDETGLVLDRGNDQISFIHLSFQEYLAAWVFLCGTDLPKGASFFLEHLGDPAWEEVLLLRLYIVLRGGGGGVDEFDLIVGAILRALERKSIPEGWLTLVRAIRDDLEFREGDRKEILRKAVGYWLQEAILIGQWHEALEEVNVFGERAKPLLHDLITTMRNQASAQSELLHLLRLETELYGFPDDAPTRLKVRTDLTELLEPLIRYFAKQPLLRPIFAEHATLANWALGMRRSLGFDGYHLLVRWMADPPSIVATQAGMAMLWQKVLQTFDLLVTYADMSTTELSARSFGLHNVREVQATATAWDELCKTFTNPTGPTAAFVIAHAAYATLISTRECNLPFTPDLHNPCVHFSHLLYERCISRNPETNAKAIEQTLANPPAELRPLLEAVELIKPAQPPSEVVRPAITTGSPAPQASPPERVLFSWLHLSDMHFGHRNTSHRWNQKLVIETLHEDLTKLRERDIPIPESMFVTGDIAFSGSAEQYAEGSVWLDKVAATLAITRERIFVVPGNHDIDRTVDRNDRNVARLIRGLRDGDDLVDEILENKSDRALLASRMAAYLAFAARYPALQSPDPLYWSHAFVTPNGLPVRVIGLPTALLAAGDIDHGKLRLGQMPLASTLTDANKDREFVLVLTHHPLRGGWLADQRDTDGWVQNRAHVHLFGHVHEADSEAARSGSGSGILRIAAGAVHGDMLPADVPASHGYALGAVIAKSDEPLRVRIWPRLWSEPNKEFRVDVHNVPEGKTFADHPLDGRLKVKGA
ncbi:MAG TPA: metallophosphoesterase, partial [Polyangium sp.]|nr:metallophosphoesterase [Polyangium sp.]